MSCNSPFWRLMAAEAAVVRAAREGDVTRLASLLPARKNGSGRESEAIPHLDAETLAAALCWACGEGHVRCSKLLLDAGVPPSAKEAKRRRTPLHFAARAGREVIALLLLERGAAADATSQHGVTPIQLACWQNHNRLVRLLIDAGADPQGNGFGAALRTGRHSARARRAVRRHVRVVQLPRTGVKFTRRTRRATPPCTKRRGREHSRNSVVIKWPAFATTPPTVETSRPTRRSLGDTMSLHVSERTAQPRTMRMPCSACCADAAAAARSLPRGARRATLIELFSATSSPSLYVRTGASMR